jgi:2-polyprenyl-3-methyl-5-hydroxy-6-metoxy-1,4-benzoquinol methylase
MKKDINKECQKIWEDLGPWWDASVEDGDYFHRAFLYPNIEKLLELRGGETVLDAGCGNGALSRFMTKKGAEVFGIDFSSTLLKQAQKRSPGIKFEQMDLTDGAKLKKLGDSQNFDRIVCSMVLHDMSNIRPFFESLSSLLKPRGSFIFSIPHPCFNSASVLFKPMGCLTISDYIHPKTSKMRSKPGQPIEQLVFHRPLTEYFNLLMAQGMVMNGFEEPCVDPKLLPEKSLWGQRSEIPPALISRWIFA